MKNLSKFGVQELNAQEIKETQGGIAPLVVVLAIVAFFAGTQKAH